VLGPLLERHPRTVTIANRTLSTAQELTREFTDLGSVTACGLDDLSGPPFDLIINGTSAGVQGALPRLPASLVDRSSVCYDMVYGPDPTPFTRWAISLQASRTAKGWGMLVEQAAESFFLWRGIRPDTRPVLERLAPYF
ncbi:MAG: shikimate dehydrogenase, partial [Pseudomonadota bacterium]|nr:shikimate dehydrogenase [Pseudomonadota bacterium]